jgi:RNA polymerase sigma-70 factor (ECF subfamily)
VDVQQWSLAVNGSDERPIAEAALLRAAQAGDRAALEQFVALHERPVRVLCHGILGHVEDAEDAAQETFLRALRALPRFQHGQATLRTWLFRIAVNVCLNWKRSRRPMEPWDEEHSQPGLESASPEAIALCRLQVTEALGRLSPRHRAVLLLKVVEGWSLAEIGAAMGWNRVRVKNELASARRTLAQWQEQNRDRGAEP